LVIEGCQHQDFVDNNIIGQINHDASTFGGEGAIAEGRNQPAWLDLGIVHRVEGEARKVQNQTIGFR
jgi:hypothetical protein